MKILLIEDDQKKSHDIVEYLCLTIAEIDVVVKESYQSGIRELIAHNYDLLLLDMSIPTWDKSINEPGGNFEKFGGIKILKECARRSCLVNTLLITMFSDFGDGDSSINLAAIDTSLKESYPDYYQGVIYYSSRDENWKLNLDKFFHQFTEKKE
ncbi:hypothetical protein [Lewinella sp. IMCC34183]|uniref:hypothetical protein n=1 Tax=Lewinella sp. IMCC34183 TaxID=2248762 RepID=UPI001300281D|nr:hypothetical protein [Lewinella sp. IMCC34183]